MFNRDLIKRKNLTFRVARGGGGGGELTREGDLTESEVSKGLC